MTLRPQSANCRLNTDDLNTKSLLQSRMDIRATGSKFFDNNRVRTGTCILQNGNNFSVLPFYDKRKTKEFISKSQWTQSWNSNVHNNKNPEHAGMGLGKTLVSYHPHRQRSRIMTQSYIPPQRNTSSVQFGNRAARDTKHYKTTYNNNFKGATFLGISDSHPGITAYKNRWIRKQIAK